MQPEPPTRASHVWIRRNAYNGKVAKTLGRIQIVFGIPSISGAFFIEYIIFCACFFTLAGIVTVLASEDGRRGLILASLLTSIIAAVCAGYQCLASAIGIVGSYIYAYNVWGLPFLQYVLLVVGGVELIVSIISCCMACRAICCSCHENASHHAAKP